MHRRFRSYDPGQLLLLPPDLRAWLPENHLALFVSDVVDELDVSRILRVYDGEYRGQPPYHPVMLVKLLVYAYCTGRPSSRAIEKATYEDVAYRVLSANSHPDHDTIATFRQRHLQALAGLFVDVLRLCQQAGRRTTGRRVSPWMSWRCTRVANGDAHQLGTAEQHTRAGVDGLASCASPAACLAGESQRFISGASPRIRRSTEFFRRTCSPSSTRPNKKVARFPRTSSGSCRAFSTAEFSRRGLHVFTARTAGTTGLSPSPVKGGPSAHLASVVT